VANHDPLLDRVAFAPARSRALAVKPVVLPDSTGLVRSAAEMDHDRVKKLAAVVILFLALGPAVTRADVDLWPLLEISDESTTVLYPFYVKEGPFLMIFPFYYRTNEGRDHHFLWPFLKLSNDRLVRVAPVWFGEQEGEFTLFPVIRQTQDYTLLSVPPVYLRRDGAFEAVVPLLWHSKNPTAETLVTLPGYYRRRESSGRRVEMLWPLARWERDAQLERFHLGWRLFGWDRRGDEEKEWAGYLFHRERGPERWWYLLAPIVSVYREQEKRGLYLFPYYQQRGPDLSTTGVFPLWERRSEGDTDSLWILPYYRHRSPEKAWTAVFPFFVHTRGPAADSPGVTREWLSILWPLYDRTERRTPDGRLVERSRRFAIFSDRLDESGTRTLKILGIPVIERTR
jgi:hypothetical protein